MKNNIIILLFASLEMVSALLIALVVYYFLPMATRDYQILAVWWVILASVWAITADIDRKFIFEPFLKPVIVATYTAIGYLLFFVVSREFYSINFMLWATMCWLLFSILLRSLMYRIHRPLRVLCVDPLLTDEFSHPKIILHTVHAKRATTLADYDFVVFDYHQQHDSVQQKLLTNAHAAGVAVLPAYELLEAVEKKVYIEYLDEMWFRQACQINPIYIRVKRFIDIVLVVLLAPVVLFVSAIVAGLIWAKMGSPIFFTQQRIGLDGKLFKIFKFRTMLTQPAQSNPNFTQQDDMRITRLGTLLRQYRLDELPQFYNVLIGKMSLIGPRPEQPGLAHQFAKDVTLYAVRYWLRPGISGWAQVKQGYADNNDTTKEKTRYDMYYVKHCSLWLDIKIIMKTIYTIITGFGAR